MEDISEVQTKAMKGVMDAGEILVRGLSNFGQEWMEFVTARVQRNFDTQSSLMACTSVAEAAEVQRKYVRETLEDYSTESNKLMKLGSEIVKEDIDVITQPEAPFWLATGNTSANGKAKREMAA